MAKVHTVTTAFNGGELSPKIYGRVDLEQYYNGCKQLQNCTVYPQGGMSKRYGMEHISTLDDSSASEDFRVEPFVFNDQESYVIILTNDYFIYIYDANTLELIDKLPSPYGGELINTLSFSQSQDSAIITHPEIAPQILLRDRTKADVEPTWTIKPVALKRIPDYVFDPIAPSTWDGSNISFSSFSNGKTFKLTVGVTDTAPIPYNVSYSQGVYDDKNDVYLQGNANASVMVNSLQAAMGGNYNVSAIYTNVKFTYYDYLYSNSNGTKNYAKRDVYYNRLNYISIRSAVEGTSDYISLHSTAANTGTYVAMVGDGTVAPTAEPVWSETRGWPATNILHQGRLWFGGSKSRPQTLWASRSGSYFDFGVEDANNLLANDALDTTLNDTRSNAIVSLSTQKNLVVFTSGGVFTVDGENNLITPATVFTVKQSDIGSKWTPSVQLDNTTLYLQSSGSQLNSINYNFSSDSYVTAPQALLSDHLIVDPKSVAMVNAGDDYNSSFIVVVNGDGSLAMYNRKEDQAISTWSPYRTDGTIISACGIYDKLFCLVKRESINSNGVDAISNYITLEVMHSDNAYIDSYNTYTDPVDEHGVRLGVRQIPASDSNKRFEGKELVAVIDEYPVRGLYTNADGSIDIPFLGFDIEYGLPYDMTIETMPFAANLQSGSTRFKRKRVTKATLDMVDSLGFDVEYAGRKYTVADRRMGFKLKEAPQPTTDLKEVRLLGYNTEGNIKIISNEPVPVKLRSLQLEVSVTG